MSKITINTRPGNVISITNKQRGYIKTISTRAGTGATRLGELTDVDVTAADNNETLVYDANTNKYVIKELPIINGGEF